VRLRFATLRSALPGLDLSSPQDLEKALAIIDRAIQQLGDRRKEVVALLGNHSDAADE
jgi:hypothetical protein